MSCCCLLGESLWLPFFILYYEGDIHGDTKQEAQQVAREVWGPTNIFSEKHDGTNQRGTRVQPRRAD